MNRLWKAGIVGVVLLALGGVAAGIVAAQTSGGTPTPTEQSATATAQNATPSDQSATPSDAAPTGKEAVVQDFLSKLAANLGISVDALEQAIRNTQLDQLDEAVADGRVPEDRAAEIRERIESGDAPLFPFGGGRRGHWHRGFAGVGLDQVAEFLGLEPQDVVQALRDGGTLAGLAEAHGKTADGLSSYLYDQLKSRLDQAVQSGRITQAQEDTILSNAQARIDQAINRVGPFFGGPHGFPQDGDAPDGLPMTPGDGSAPQENGLFF